MPTLSSPTPRPSPAQPISALWRGLSAPDPRERGQALVLLTLSFVALLAFVGLVTDVGSLYNAYGQLKRGVDAAVLSSAVQFRETGDVAELSRIAEETLAVNGVDNISAVVYICDNDGNGLNDDPTTLTTPDGIDPANFHTEFVRYCNPTNGTVTRKFVWVYAKQQAPVYFLHLFGVTSVNLTTYSISEAATLDIVLVLDTSESMAIQPCDDPSDSDGDDPNQFDCIAGDDVLNPFNASITSCAEISGCDPGNYSKFCNSQLATAANADPDGDHVNACYPFFQVKAAAASFIGKVNFPYDRVSIVTFDGNRFDCPSAPTNPCPPSGNGVDTYSFPNPPSARLNLAFTSDRQTALDTVSLDPGVSPLRVYYEDETYKTLDVDAPFGPGNEDFELNHADPLAVTYDDLSKFCTELPGPAQYGEWLGGAPNPGVPNPFTDEEVAQYVLRFCGASNVGGGMRVAEENLRKFGRPNSVWVIVFLADGFTNLSDLPPIVDGSYSNGFCQGPNNAASGQPDGWFMIRPLCTDNVIKTRYCSDPGGASTCPPSYSDGSNSWTVTYDNPLTQPNLYNVEDYARDQADAAALQVNAGTGPYYNPSEPLGGNAVIYTIGLGSGIKFQSDQVNDDTNTLTSAAAMLRYFAAVGDDGDRVTDQCYVNNNPKPVDQACGNYYYAPDAAGLARIFDAIAEKVFFRISQ